MAELDVGRHCAVEQCGQLDFLPFVCNGCAKVFCLEHRGKDDHACTEATPGRAAPAGGGPTSYACHVPACPARELLPVLCPHCSLQVCLRHRHQVDHACVNLQEAAPRMQRTQELVRGITEGRCGAAAAVGRRGARSAAVTARVQLMKTKQQAVGEQGIPQEERLYLRVRLPRTAGVSEGQQQQQEERAVFVSRAWSVGRVVDWVASATRLPNNNHVASAKKLHLCDVATLRAWPMDALVDSLLSAPGSEGEGLGDGGGVLLKYLDPGCDVAPDASPPSAT
ncbi:AN1-type zinc finger protein 1-like isoform X1 [Lethenteron reissneri]|uniref:AN1-type zinc finger protein 1-like isoform X1 n=1 Tax=Lethenteron reissneri TaxID=7753 RepID=UPI002AB64484|nr:AN1-type zinc finger protein 1-like isoform X1 [Lethenteron reissneri]XP_061428167.1 AN1-type zinc finger protein 1-like isoform X1 [Lethenteron reissneri]